MFETRQMLKSFLTPVWQTVRRFARAPFQNMPPAFGDTVPPELRVFEAEVEEIQHHAVGDIALPTAHGHKPQHLLL